jgi:hypothetical protein
MLFRADCSEVTLAIISSQQELDGYTCIPLNDETIFNRLKLKLTSCYFVVNS